MATAVANIFQTQLAAMSMVEATAMGNSRQTQLAVRLPSQRWRRLQFTSTVIATAVANSLANTYLQIHAHIYTYTYTHRLASVAGSDNGDWRHTLGNSGMAKETELRQLARESEAWHS